MGRSGASPMKRSNGSSSSSIGGSPSAFGSPMRKTKQQEEHDNLVNYSSYVYVHDAAYSWMPAKVVSMDKANHLATVKIVKPHKWTETTVFSSPSTPSRYGRRLSFNKIKKSSSHDEVEDSNTRTVELTEYPNYELPLQNVQNVSSSHRIKLTVKPDMADLPFLHEASVLYNVKELYCRPIHASLAAEEQCTPYTRVGDIVIALNPFQWMPHLYSDKQQLLYAERLVWSVPPPSSSSSNANSSDSDGEDASMASSNVNANDSKSAAAAYSFFLKAGYPPHVYETSSLAYRALSHQGRNQTILVSGESGAGKTETVKIVMSHLAKIQSQKSDARSDIVERVLESNPLFEAFGNAKTVRNDNSSRFGKFTSLVFQIHRGSTATNSSQRNVTRQKSSYSLTSNSDAFSDADDEEDDDDEDSQEARRQRFLNRGLSTRLPFEGKEPPYGVMVGSTTETYLLEKSRVVSHGSSERTYHVFYQLLKAPQALKERIWPGVLADKTMDDFRYVQCDVECKEADDFERTVRDLEVFDIVDDKLMELMRALCIVMQLGNITFGQDGSSPDASVVTSPDELDDLADLMGVDPNVLEDSFTTRQMEARGETFAVDLSPATAKDGCDALAKEVYARVFDYLVQVINRATAVDLPEDSHEHAKLANISILDLFGFEAFEVNRFEQLCINYANEKLQQKYVMDNFRLVQDEYVEEGIELFDLSKVDNSAILELLEGRMGVILTLNDECLRPNGSGSSFVYKIKTMHKESSKHIVCDRLHRPEEFGIRHFAGPITYDATHFVERNNDKIPSDLLQCALECNNGIIREQFQVLKADLKKKSSSASGGRRSVSTNNKTVAAKFKRQLGELMVKIDDSRTRYIRCIRPNRDMQPGMLDHNSTIRQLASAGLVTAITISRETFPDRLDYDTLWDRFNVLLGPGAGNLSLSLTSPVKKSNLKARVQELISLLLEGFGHKSAILGSVKTPYALGKTKVYFRTGALEWIESKREEYYAARAMVIQRLVRAKICRWHFQKLRRTCFIIQARMKGSLARRKFLGFLASTILLQSYYRRNVERDMYERRRMLQAVVLLQTRFRGRTKKVSMDLWRNAASVIQRWYKRGKSKTLFSSALAKCVEDARTDVEIKVLERRLAALGGDQVEHVDLLHLASDCVKLLEYSRSEMFKLRRTNADLKSDVTQFKSKNRKLLEYHNSFEAALAVSNRRIVQLGRSNTALVSEVATHTKRTNALEREMKDIQDAHDQDLHRVEDEHQQMFGQKDAEITKLKKGVEKLKHLHKKELYKAKKERRKLRERHAGEVEDLKEELRTTQEVHHDYLNKLMDVLENAHTAREQEEVRLKEEYEARLLEKDRYIDKLQNDLLAMRKVVQRAKTARR